MNETSRRRKLLIVGLTLFSMFFGAGNLIFPPFLAVQAGTSVGPALLGFLVSAVGLPVLGVIAVSRAGGLDCLAGKVHPVFSKVFTVLIYLSIGPCLAIPRTASTSFEMTVLPVLGKEGAGMWQIVYSVVFFLIAAFLAFHPEKLTERLGKLLCPTLLGLIFVMFVGSLFAAGKVSPAPAADYIRFPFVKGFLEGYQTMDAIAALNFGIIISLNIKAIGIEREEEVIGSTIKSGLITGIFLTAVYCTLAYIGIKAGSDAQILDNGAKVLTFMAEKIFGPVGVGILGVLFFIACLNTCVGLLSCCSEFFCQLLPAMKYRVWVFLFAAVSLIVSNAGLTRILAFSVPLLNGIYPIAIILIFLSFFRRGTESMYRLSILLTGIVSVVYALEGAGLKIPGAADVFSLLPGYSLGLGWIFPGLIGAVLGRIFTGIERKEDTGKRLG